MDELSQHEFLNHIGGEWVACASGATVPNLNPADSADVVGRFQQSDAADGARAVAAAPPP
ncbi:aldehyde dehydrogenase family protein, partial [Achromobacter ruhlandii]